MKKCTYDVGVNKEVVAHIEHVEDIITEQHKLPHTVEHFINIQVPKSANSEL